jgi:hypothetical protein
MQDLPLLHPRTHNGFLDMQYDDRYTPFLQRAGLDVISFQVRRGLPMFNSAALTKLVIIFNHCLHSYAFVHALAFLTCNIALPKM